MDKRKYNKLFVHKNREEGSDKILLGYKYNAKDLILEKDKETYFHVPFFISPTSLANSSLIEDGATAGPFPAAADRIFKSKKGYGQTTNHGTPSDFPDGVWFCSWLYEAPNGDYIWMDRYYNPGSIRFETAMFSLDQNFIYVANDPVFRDVESKTVLDPGVLYKYFHIGESTARDLVTTFGGSSGERLKLNLTEWDSEENVDTSLEPKKLITTTDGDTVNVFTLSKDSKILPKKVISFNTNQNTNSFIFYDKSYCLTDETTWSFWAQSPDWLGVSSTQLIGNYSSAGGVGIHVETLSSYPLFVVPETNYGHLLLVNEIGEGIIDKSTQVTPKMASRPSLVAVNRDNHVVVCHRDSSGTLYKIDVAGKVLAKATDFFVSANQKNIPREGTTSPEEPVQIICGLNDAITVITNKGKYEFDKHLNLIQASAKELIPYTLAAYRYNLEEDAAFLEMRSNVLDLKFIRDKEWFISAIDKNLYRNQELFAVFEDGATSFAVDPYERIWVCHGRGDISVFDSLAKSQTSPSIKINFNLESSKLNPKQHISFFCAFDRSTGTRAWRSMLHYNDEKYIFFTDLDGNLVKKVDKYSLFYADGIKFLEQDSNNFKFEGTGDFTGYEHRRVFNQLSPFKNSPQLAIKLALKDTEATDLIFSHFSSYSPLNLKPNTFYHFVLVLDGQEYTLFCNTKKIASLKPSGKYVLSYELQPSFYIGTAEGSKFSLNEEVKHTTSIFNGEIADVKVFDYALTQDKLKLFLREAIPAQNMVWTLPSAETQYIEKIERFFKNKLPGFKTTFFNISLAGSKITDPNTRSIIEELVREIAKESQPANTELLKIKWVD